MIDGELYNELHQMAKRLNDDDFNRALEVIEDIIAMPDVAPAKARVLVAELQAIAFKFSMLKVYYMSIEKDTLKKNIYYRADEAVNRMVDALKYVARV